MNDTSQKILVFWSWQSDSPNKTNRNLIENAIKKAISKINKSTMDVIEIDRDTKGVGGSPDIAQTILKKILHSDIFIWDATLCYSDPKPSPNPNVLFELGYAFSVLGPGRIIGVMNTATGFDGQSLPFDLRNRRWPIDYSLKLPGIFERSLFRQSKFQTRKKTVEDQLTQEIQMAIQAALSEPKVTAFQADVDSFVIEAFWGILDSKTMTDWYNWKTTFIQYDKKSSLNKLREYVQLSEMPENKFKNQELSAIHDQVIAAIRKYLSLQSVEMVPNGDDTFVISTKTSTVWVEDYDKKYDAQCNRLYEAIESVHETGKNM